MCARSSGGCAERRVNDVGTPIFAAASEIVCAEQIIAGLRQLAERAHERGIVAYGATITPFAESHFIGEETEAMRQAVNDWIRTGGAFDAGIRAMGEAIDLALFEPA